VKGEILDKIEGERESVLFLPASSTSQKRRGRGKTPTKGMGKEEKNLGGKTKEGRRREGKISGKEGGEEWGRK